MRLEGELTIYTVTVRKAEVLALAQGASGQAAIDLSGLDELDGAGVQLLLYAQAAAQREGRALAWTRASGAAAEALAVAGLSTEAP